MYAVYVVSLNFFHPVHSIKLTKDLCGVTCVLYSKESVYAQMQTSPALFDVANRAGFEARGSGIKHLDQLAPKI